MKEAPCIGDKMTMNDAHMAVLSHGPYKTLEGTRRNRNASSPLPRSP